MLLFLYALHIYSLFCCKSLVYVFFFFIMENFPPIFPLLFLSHSLNVVNGVFGELENLYYNIIMFCVCVFVCMMMGEFFHISPFNFPVILLSHFIYTSIEALCVLYCVCMCILVFYTLFFFYYLFYDCLKWPILSRLTTQIAHFLLLLLSIISV